MRIGNTLYLDHQATTPTDPRVVSAMTPYFVELFGNPHSADHVLGWQSAQAVELAAAKVASLIGADPDEIIFTSGATEANNLALLGVARRATGGKRRRILVSSVEHKCVLEAARKIKEQLAYRVEIVPVDENGFVVFPTLVDALDDDVLVVSIMAANNEIGTIQDVENLSKAIARHGALFHCDAAQATVAVDLHNISHFADFVSLSAHKMYGPKGIGALFVRRDLQGRLEPLIYGGGQQNGLRSGTIPTPLCVGMAAAADLLNGGEADVERAALCQRSERFITGLRQLPQDISVNGVLGPSRHPGNANVCFKGYSAHDILAALQPKLAASTGSACTSGIQEPSHVLRAIGLSSEDADASIRFSLGRFTTDEDVDQAIELIAQTLSKLEKSRSDVHRA